MAAQFDDVKDLAAAALNQLAIRVDKVVGQYCAEPEGVMQLSPPKRIAGWMTTMFFQPETKTIYLRLRADGNEYWARMH
jgi:hypothetical protein